MVVQRELTKQSGVTGICLAASIIELVCLDNSHEADFQDVVAIIKASRLLRTTNIGPDGQIRSLLGADGFVGDNIQFANNVCFHFGFSKKYSKVVITGVEPLHGAYIVKLEKDGKTHFVAFYKDTDGWKDSRDTYPGYTDGYKVVEYRQYI